MPKALFPLAMFVAALAGTSCADLQKDIKITQATIDNVLPVEQCVISQIAAGNTDPVAIGGSCARIAASAVIAIAQAFEDMNSMPVDAGAPTPTAAKVHAFLVSQR